MATKKSRQFGNWSTPGFPHKNWELVGSHYLEEDDQLCEMCGHAFAKHVHFMRHPNFSRTLTVGAKCASRMQELGDDGY
jgi:hypothetical protein